MEIYSDFLSYSKGRHTNLKIQEFTHHNLEQNFVVTLQFKYLVGAQKHLQLSLIIGFVPVLGEHISGRMEFF